MKDYFSRLAIVAAIFIFSIGIGVLVTQEGGSIPLVPEQLAATNGIHEITWSPDGKFIAYVSNQNGNSEIWIVSATGGTPKRLTSSGVLKKQPRWSGDGQWIAYVALAGTEGGDIEIVSPDGQTGRSITETTSDERNPVWSPDSGQIAFTEQSEDRGRLMTVDVRTNVFRSLAQLSASDLQWSPDGSSIAFVSNPMLSVDSRRDNEDIFIVSIAGGPPRLLTPGTQRFRDWSPSWSADSRYLAHASDSNGYSNIFIADTQTGTRRPLHTEPADQLSPAWSPDGKNIAYVRNINAGFHVWMIPLAGGSPVQLSDRDGVNGGFKDEESGPQGRLQWAPDSKRLAYTHSDPARTSDVWTVGLDAARPVQLTNSMPADLRREARFVWPDPVTYRSFDGQEVSGLVYKPRIATPRSGHPALLVFRESLEGQHSLTWDPFIQFFVSEGYVVFAPNVRGSSGYGKEYRQLVFQNGGDHDVRDAFVGLDRLSSEGLIDTERVGVFGAGTGGFLATVALIRDEARFRAAVCLYGIVDAVTAASYPSMTRWSQYMIGESPMQAPLPFYERSLVNFVDKLRTPIVFLYAANDTAAPFQQLQQFGVQASVKGKWFDYKVLDNETAGWQYWRPASLKLALEAMQALFEKHVLGIPARSG